MDTTLCDIPSFSLNATTPNATYLWQDNSTNAIFTATQTGTYSVTITDNNNCSGSDAIQLTFSQSPQVNLGNDTTYCNTPTIILDATTVGGVDYIWQDGTHNATYTVTAPGTYTVNVTNNDNCTGTDNISIFFISTDAFDLGNDTVICENEFIVLDAFIQGASYWWQDNSTSSSFMVTEAGTYSVVINHPAGCSITDSIQVGFAPPLEVIDLPFDTTLCTNQTVTFNAYQPNATTYQWEGASGFFGQNDPTDTSFLAIFEGIYRVTVSNGCDALTHVIEVFVEDCSCTPFIPSAFSPNFDGINDEFRVFSNCPLENFSMQIFDRWGNRLYFSADRDTGWDGTFNGQVMDTNIYVWMIEFEAEDETGKVVQKVLTGDVTLMK